MGRLQFAKWKVASLSKGAIGTVVIQTIDGQPATDFMIIPNTRPVIVGYITNPFGSAEGASVSFGIQGQAVDGYATTGVGGTFTYTFQNDVPTGEFTIEIIPLVPGLPSEDVIVVTVWPETTAFINKVIANGYTPNAAYEQHIDALVNALKVSNTWDLFDALILAVGPSPSTQCLVDLMLPSRNVVASGTYTWTPDGGWRGNGTTGLVGGIAVPDLTTSKFKLDDASIFCYSLTAGSNGNYHYGENAGSGNVRVRARGGTNDGIRLNGSTALSATGTTGVPSMVMGCIYPSDTTKQRILRNGVLNANGVRGASSGPSSAFNIGKTAASFSDATIAAVGHGASLTEAQCASVYNALRTFLLARGLSV